jgi:uncharacterized protein (TIGR02996 family)
VAVYCEGLAKLPHDARMHIVYADYLCDTGRPDEAQKFYDQADRLAPPKTN